METNEPIYIRNMVCDRCRMVVRELFAELGIETRSVELGVVRTAAPVAEELRKRLGERLRELRAREELISERIPDSRRILSAASNASRVEAYTPKAWIMVAKASNLARTPDWIANCGSRSSAPITSNTLRP